MSAFKYYVVYHTACGCTRIQGWHEHPHWWIEVLIPAKPKIAWDDDDNDLSTSHARREFEYTYKETLPHGTVVMHYAEVTG